MSARSHRERPIIFGAESVRAILSGFKSQTRRLVRLPGWFLDEYGGRYGAHEIRAENDCPYGVPGDRLWVRETWGYRGSCWTSSTPAVTVHRIQYRADETTREVSRAFGDESGIPKHVCRCKPVGKGRDSWDVQWDHGEELRRYWKSWRPSIHMPRWASRLTLEVTSVRVERLQDIGEADALAEGVGPYLPGHGPVGYPEPGTSHRDSFALLWDDINGKRAPWERNPWVWVISFQRVEQGRG